MAPGRAAEGTSYLSFQIQALLMMGRPPARSARRYHCAASTLLFFMPLGSRAPEYHASPRAACSRLSSAWRPRARASRARTVHGVDVAERGRNFVVL